jgi:hypothetical protein
MAALINLGTNGSEWWLQQGRPNTMKRAAGTRWDKRMGGTHSWSGRFGEDRLSCLRRKSKQGSSSCPACSRVQLSPNCY